MTITWPELDAARWEWADAARAEIRWQLSSVHDPDEVAKTAHIMVLGDTNAGKTTLLLTLLGVIGDENKHARDVLSAGRGAGRSSTATPIRYGWSGTPDLWLLRGIPGREPVLLTDEALAEELRTYRSSSGEGLTWRIGDPPLEIGLPHRLATGPERPQLKVIDLPGLHADSVEELMKARELVARTAPSMSMIIIVQAASKVNDAMKDPAIMGDAYLRNWYRSPEQFRLVFTRAFTAASVAEELDETFGTDEGTPWEAAEVAEWIRQHMITRIARSAPGPVDGDRLKEIVFPVEIGDTWTNLDPRVRGRIGPTNSFLLNELQDGLEKVGTTDGYYLTAPVLVGHVAGLTLSASEARKKRIDALNVAVTRAEQEARNAVAFHRKVTADLKAAEEDAACLHADVAALYVLPFQVDRPGRPEMKGVAVRESQDDDKNALRNAAAARWTRWRDAALRPMLIPASLPMDFESRLRTAYTGLAECCEKCTHRAAGQFFLSKNSPEECYRKMTEAFDGMGPWIIAELFAIAEPLVERADERAHEKRKLADAAYRHANHRQSLVGEAKAALKKAEQEHEELESIEAKERAIASTVLAAHSRHNRRYVQELADRAEGADQRERLALGIAALRAVYDLNRIYGNRG